MAALGRHCCAQAFSLAAASGDYIAVPGLLSASASLLLEHGL